MPGGDSCPPADDAEQLVPADALAYVHANLDPETEQYEAAAEIAERVPVLSGQLADRALALLPGPAAGRPTSSAIGPWFGGEVAVAVLAGTGPPQRVELLEVADADGASEFAAAIAAGEARPRSTRGSS